MTALFNSNLVTIQQRWPTLAVKLAEIRDTNKLTIIPLSAQCQTLLVNERQLTSAYDRIKEAKVQCESIPLNAKQAFVYGTALGDIQHQLLQRPELESLHVCILNHNIFAAALSYQPQVWLQDPRVTLHDYSALTEVYSPFVVSPPELELASPEAAKLRDRVLLELDHDYVISMHSNTNDKVMQAINSNYEIISQDPSIEVLGQPGKEKKHFS